MSIKVMSAVWAYGPKDSTQRFVLLALADNASDDGGNAYPSIMELARKCAMSERTVIRAIDALIERGYLSRRRRRNNSNIYQIQLKVLVSDKLSLTDDDKLSPPDMTDCHPDSDTMSPLEVTDCHVGGDTVSHDPSINHPIKHPINQGSAAPAPPVVQYGTFDRTPKGKGYQLPDEPEASHPSVRLLQNLTRCWPGEGNIDFIAGELGDAPDETALKRAVDLWRASGHNIRNWLGIIDWYKDIKRDPAWTPQARFKNGNGRQPAPAKSVSTPAPGSQPVTW